GHLIHRREGDQVHGAGHVADGHRTDGEFFHCPGLVADLDHIALVHDVLELDEDAGYDVLHQLLGTETDGEANHPRTGEERGDVHPDLRQGQHQPEYHQGDGEGVLEQAQQGLFPCRWHPAGRDLEPIFHPGRDHHREHDADEQDQAGGDHRTDGSKAGIAERPFGNVEDAPGLDDGSRHHDNGYPANDLHHPRYESLEPGFQQWQPLLDLRREVEAEGNGAGDEGDDQRSNQDRNNGLNRRPEHEGQRFIWIGEPQHQQRQQIGDRKHVPELAEQAQQLSDAVLPPRAEFAQPGPDVVAVLHDDDDADDHSRGHHQHLYGGGGRGG